MTLTDLINEHGIDTMCETPDFILSFFLMTCLNGLETVINDRKDFTSDAPAAQSGINKKDL